MPADKPQVGELVHELSESDMLATPVSAPHRGSNGETPPDPKPEVKQSEPVQEETPQPDDGNHTGGGDAGKQAPPVASSSSFLSQVTTGVQAQAFRVLLYGPGGIGKSYMASQIPQHIFMDLEQGTGHLAKAARLPKPQDMEEVRTQLRELATQPHEFTTLVIDSADRMELLIEEEVCRENSVNAIDEIGYYRGHGMVGAKWASLLQWLTRLWERRQMNILIVAHNDIKKFTDPMAMADYDRHQIRLGKKSAPLVFEWADVVLFANFRRRTQQEDAGFGEVKNRVLHTEERILYTQDHPAAAAKSRIDLPAEMPMEWPVLAKHLQQKG